MHASLITFMLASFAVAAPVPRPAADANPQSWYGPGYNNSPPPSSSWFGTPAPPKPAPGITLSGPPGTSHFGADGSVALSNGAYGVSYNPKPAPPKPYGSGQTYGAWKLNAVAASDGAEEQAAEEKQDLPTAEN